MAADYMKKAGSYKDAPTLMKEQAYLYGSSITDVWSTWLTQKADDLIAYLDLASGYRDARELSLQYKYAYVVDAEREYKFYPSIEDYLLDNCVIALEYTEDLIKANYNGQATRFRAIQSALKTITANVK